MKKDKFTAQDIIDTLSADNKRTKRLSEDFYKALISTIEEGLSKRESVKIKDLGTFKLQWVASRKSVNVQTGEEIIINGYYKVNFTPDTELKNLLNKPFAHLETVFLDEDKKPVKKTVKDTIDPIASLGEQAKEIKGLLNELQEVSIKIETPDNELSPIEEIKQQEPKTENISAVIEEKIQQYKAKQASPIIIEEKIEEKIPENNLSTIENITENKVEESKLEEPIAHVIEPEKEEKVSEIIPSVPEDKIEENRIEEPVAPVMEEKAEEPTIISSVSEVEEKKPEETGKEVITQKESQKKEEPTSAPIKLDEIQLPTLPKKKKTWLWVLLITLGLLISAFFVFFFYNWNFNQWVHTHILKDIQEPINEEGIKNQLDEILQLPIEEIEEEIVQSTVRPVRDEWEEVFNARLNNPEYIATVKVNEGSRLAFLAERYYGSPHYWVYIYEANKDKIRNPNMVNEGTTLRIPKLDERLINKNDQRTIDKALELKELYNK